MTHNLCFVSVVSLWLSTEQASHLLIACPNEEASIVDRQTKAPWLSLFGEQTRPYPMFVRHPGIGPSRVPPAMRGRSVLSFIQPSHSLAIPFSLVWSPWAGEGTPPLEMPPPRGKDAVNKMCTPPVSHPLVKRYALTRFLRLKGLPETLSSADVYIMVQRYLIYCLELSFSSKYFKERLILFSHKTCRFYRLHYIQTVTKTVWKVQTIQIYCRPQPPPLMSKLIFHILTVILKKPGNA